MTIVIVSLSVQGPQPASPISLLLRTKWSKFLISSEAQINLSLMCERDKKILECRQHGCLEPLETRICWCGIWHQSASLRATGKTSVSRPREINSVTPKLFAKHGQTRVGNLYKTLKEDSREVKRVSNTWSLFYSILPMSFLGEVLAMLRLLDICLKHQNGGQNGIVASLLPW